MVEAINPVERISSNNLDGLSTQDICLDLSTALDGVPKIAVEGYCAIQQDTVLMTLKVGSPERKNRLYDILTPIAASHGVDVETVSRLVFQNLQQMVHVAQNQEMSLLRQPPIPLRFIPSGI